MSDIELKTGIGPEELILQAQEGNKEAFRALVKEYQRFAYSVSFKILLNEEDAKDAAQESFIKLWRYIGKYKFEAKFTTWFYKIVVNMSLDKLKSRKRKESVEITGCEENWIENTAACQAHDYSPQELADIINVITNKLSTKQRLVFTLRDLNGFSVNETAEALHMSEGSIRSNLVYARHKIKEYLTQTNKRF